MFREIDYSALPMRQSMAKVLLTDCAAELRHQLEHGRVATRAMEGGSLLDYLVFGLDSKYEVVDARYASGERVGEQCTDWTSKASQLARKEATARGLLAALPIEIDEMEPQAAEARARFAELREQDTVHLQQTIRWTSELGLACTGTPDWVLINTRTGCVRTADLKRVASVNPLKLQRQIAEMCWEVQAAAYREAALALALQEWEEGLPVPWHGGHTVIACQAEGRKAVRAYPLDAVFMEGGKKRWEKAQRKWLECIATGNWPDYPEDPIGPTLYYTRTEIESFDFAEEEP